MDLAGKWAKNQTNSSDQKMRAMASRKQGRTGFWGEEKQTTMQGKCIIGDTPRMTNPDSSADDQYPITAGTDGDGRSRRYKTRSGAKKNVIAPGSSLAEMPNSRGSGIFIRHD